MNAVALGCGLAAVGLGLRTLRGWGGALLIAAPLLTALVAAGMPPLNATLLALSIARGGSAMLRRLRRERTRQALEAASPGLARALATELALWGSGAQAITAARTDCEVAARVLDGASARVLLGADASSALHRALLDAVPRLPATSAAARLAAVFALHRHDSAAAAAALTRLADALDAEAAVHDDVRAATAEVRMSAIAVPLLAAAILALVLAGDPPALLAALSMPVLPILACGATVVVCASLAVRRLVTA